MKLKSFDEFWNTLTEDDFAEITHTANKHIQLVQEETAERKNLIGNQIAMCSTTFTKEILRRYHNWLSEQLGQIPLD